MPNLIVSSTFISESVKSSLLFWLNKSGFTENIKFTPYNQVIQQLVDSRSMLAQNNDGANLILIRFEDWQGQKNNFQELERNIDLFIKALSATSYGSKIPYIICICPYSEKQYTIFEKKLIVDLKLLSNVYAINSDEILSTFTLKNFANNFTNELGHIPYTDDLYTSLGTIIARKYFTLKQPPYKVIVLDCDNTLWKGVCGEVGPLGVEISDGYKKLQKFMLKQRDSGVLLCLCSKNNEEDVDAVFAQHPDMILKKQDISAHRINWKSKSENIISIAKELKLGLDSFIFLDDNAIEIAEIQHKCPSVLSLLVPQQQEDIENFLKNVWFFDHLKLTAEDQQRAITYQENIARDKLKQKSLTLKDFIAGLELKIEISACHLNDMNRISQLTQRTNQFNFTTIRRNEGEIIDLIKNQMECYSVRVKDRFGDYGLVGLIFFKQQQNKLKVETFLLSCRVLGKGVEHFIVSWLGNEAIKRNLNEIVIDYQATNKNLPALRFLESISTKQENSVFIIKSIDAANVKFDPDTMPYFESISESNEIKDELKMSVTHSSINTSIVDLAVKNNTIDKIRREIHNYFVKNRDEIKLNSDFVAPKDTEETILQGIWQDALQIKNIGMQDNFFQLGGNSLLAVKIVSDVMEKFQVILNIADLFDNPTLIDFHLIIKKTNRGEFKKSTDQKNENLISNSQKRFWFLEKLIGDNPIANVPVVLSFSGHLREDILKKSLDFLIKRHNIFQKIFTEKKGKLNVEELTETEFPLKKMNLCGFSNAEIQDKIKHEINRKIPLIDNNSLIRGTLFKISDQEQILTIIVHHIIADAHSLDIFFNELSQVYNALENNKIISLPHLAYEYNDYIRWQQSELKQDRINQLVYWKNQLFDAPYLELQPDKIRAKKISFNCASVEDFIDDTHLRLLKKIAINHNTTLYSVLLSIVQISLFRQSGQTDFVIGTPIANRVYPGADQLFGLFVNTLAVRAHIDKSLTFDELLNKVKQSFNDAVKHQNIPFEQVLEAVVSQRDINQHPLFPVMLVFKNERVLQTQFNHLKTDFIDYSTDATLFDLTISLEETKKGLKINFQYVKDLLEKNTIEKMLNFFKTITSEIVKNRQQKISELIKCENNKEMKLISSWNQTQKLVTKSQTLHQCFEECVQKNPDAIAVVYKGQELTYRELNQLANQFASHLRKTYQVRPGTLVAIGMESRNELLISILAILKAGGAYIPLDPEYPRERLSLMLDDAQPTVLITSSNNQKNFSFYKGKIINIDYANISVTEEKLKDIVLENSNQPSDLAYVIYTSGSTGKPKGVMIEHKGICNSAYALIKGFRVTNKSKILQFSTLSFDISVSDMVTALLSGATLHLIPPEVKRDPQKLSEVCYEYAITHLTLTPSMLAMMPDKLLPNLQVVVLAGEAPSKNLVEKWQKRVPVLINGYGPTEVSIVSSIYHYKGDKPATTIGCPLDNVKYYICDENQNPLPIGMPGELCIGGVGLARGYLNHDELTKQKFIQTNLGRIYRSGDYARFQPDGAVTFLGRMDEQLKIRGYRVELEEIESNILDFKEVQRAIVVMNSHSHLIAYIVFRDGQEFAPERMDSLLKEIYANLERKLPNFMRPSGFVVKKSQDLPLLPNGKIDRKKLANNSVQALLPVNAYSPFSDTIEFAMLELWKEVLKRDSIGVNDNFFQIGGHSLLAVTLVAKIQEKFNNVVNVEDFYSYPTIAQLSLKIKTNLQNSMNISADQALLSKCIIPIQRVGDVMPLFLIHPSFGLALPYLKLAPFFHNQPIFGMSNPYFGQSNNRFTSIKDMAEFYNFAIQTVNSCKPYMLAGWSFGGVVALEMARQMQRKNQQLKKVIMIDSYHPKCVDTQSENSIHHLLNRYKIKPLSAEGELIKFEVKKNTELLTSFMSYYKGPVTLLKAQKSGLQHKFNGWDKSICPLPKVRFVPGAHEELFDDKCIEKTSIKLKNAMFTQPPKQKPLILANGLFAKKILENNPIKYLRHLFKLRK